MNIALIVPFWDSVVQRPHHWEKQARLRQHRVDVFALSQGSASDAPSTLAGTSTRIFRLPTSLFEKIMSRGGLRQAARARFFRRWSEFVEEALSRSEYDAAIYAGPPFLNWRKGQRQTTLIYDCMDEWTAFSDAPEQLGGMEEQLAAECDLILTVSPNLQSRMSRGFPKIPSLLIPNACDYEFFAQAGGDSLTSSAVGYVGTIGSWFNWKLVRALAQAEPASVVTVVGPMLNVSLPTDLPPNVHYLDRQPYESMPRFISQFSVGIIPFDTKSKLVNAVSPIKLYEYLAVGKPVVSTPMPDVLQLAEEGIVHVASSPDQFVQAVQVAKTLSGSEPLIEKRQALARGHSWQSRWRLIEQNIAICKRRNTGEKPSMAVVR